MISKEAQASLNADMPAGAIKSREGPGGQALSYVDGHYVINRLNSVLGPAAWSYDVSAKEEFRDFVETKNGKRWAVCHTAKCVLTVGDAHMGDYGTGHGLDRDLGAAIEKSIKEASTDALKRAARVLGNSMGLALYDKAQEHVDYGEPDPMIDAKLALAACANRIDLAAWGKAWGAKVAEGLSRKAATPVLLAEALRCGADPEKFVLSIYGSDK